MFSGEEQLLDMVEEVTSNVIHSNISIVDFGWTLALEKADLGIVDGKHLDSLLSKTKLHLIESTLVSKNTKECAGDTVFSYWSNFRASSLDEDTCCN